MAKRKSISRDLHDAFENDQGLDFDQIGEDLAAEQPQAALNQREVIEHLSPRQMRPDRFQPRPILPVDIQRSFFRNELDCYQAASAWLERARKDPAVQERIDTLLRMAETFAEHGQIKPITGSWISLESHEFVFQIETGERRFWSACLQHAQNPSAAEPMLRVEVVGTPSVRRQIIENRHAEAPSAVAQAREIAALVLSEINLQPDPAQDDPNDYFRLALDPPGLTRLPRGLWDRLQPWMDLSTRRMQQMLRVLQLPTSLLEQADVHNLPYRVLEAVLAAPAEARQGLIARAIEFEMTGEEVSDLVSEIPQPQQAERRPPVTRSAPVTRALRGLRGFSKACLALNSKNQGQALDEIANTVVVDGDAEEVLDLLESLMTRIRARTKRR
jgi:hypothetical protein